MGKFLMGKFLMGILTLQLLNGKKLMERNDEKSLMDYQCLFTMHPYAFYKQKF